MEYGQGPGAVGSSQEWECACRGENTWPKGEEEWPSCKVGALENTQNSRKSHYTKYNNKMYGILFHLSTNDHGPHLVNN